MISAFTFSLILTLFVLFMLFVSLFGYSFLISINAEFRHKVFSLKIFLESFGIGVVLYTTYLYFIELFFKFDIFTVFIPILLVMGGSLAYWAKTDSKFCDKFKFDNLKKITLNFRNNKKWKELFILLSIFIMQLILQGVIETNLSLPYVDPYRWFSVSMELRTYGKLNIDDTRSYTTGYFFFLAGPLLLIEDYHICYYFVKFHPIFLFQLNVLVIYYLSKKFFSDHRYVFFTLVALLSCPYLLFRFNGALPSILATNLGFIFLLSFEDEHSLFNSSKRGLILSGIFLSHTLYGFLYLGVFISFKIWELLTQFAKKRPTKTIVTPFLKKLIPILTIFIGFIILHQIRMLFAGRDFIRSYIREPDRQAEVRESSLNTISLLLVFNSSTDLFFSALYSVYMDGILGFIFRFLNWATLFLFIGLFLRFKDRKFSKDQIQLINFIKFTFVFVLIFFILISFLKVLITGSFESLISIAFRYQPRLIEIFEGFWVILFSLVIFELIQYIKNKKIKNHHKISTNGNNLTSKNLKVLSLSILIGLGTTIYLTNVFINYELYYYTNYEDDELTEIVLYAGDYFEEKYDLDGKTTNMFLFDNVPSYIFSLLYFTELNLNHSYYYNNTSFEDLSTQIIQNNIDFAISPKYEIRSNTSKSIEKNYDLIFENHRYIFYKI